MRLSPCVLVQPDGWARGEREGYGGPCDVTSLSLKMSLTLSQRDIHLATHDAIDAVRRRRRDPVEQTTEDEERSRQSLAQGEGRENLDGGLLGEVLVVAAPLELGALRRLERQDVRLLVRHALPRRLQVAA